MNLFLHIKLVTNRFHFSKPLSIPNATYTDFDNFSEAVVVDTCLKAIDNSEKLLVYFDGAANQELGSVVRIFNKMAQYKKPLKIIYEGGHPVLDKLLRRFCEKLDTRDIEVVDVAEVFFKG